MNIFVRTAPFEDDDYYWFNVLTSESSGYSVGNYYYDLINIIDSSGESVILGAVNNKYVLWASGLPTNRTDLHNRPIANSFLMESDDKFAVHGFLVNILGNESDVFNPKFTAGLEDAIKCTNSSFDVDKEKILQLVHVNSVKNNNQEVLRDALHANLSSQTILELKKDVLNYSLPSLLGQDELKVIYCITGNQDVSEIPVFSDSSRVITKIPNDRPVWVPIFGNKQPDRGQPGEGADDKSLNEEDKNQSNDDTSHIERKMIFRFWKKKIEISIKIEKL